MYKDNIEKFAKKDYTEVTAQELALMDWSEKYGFDFGRIDIFVKEGEKFVRVE